MSIPSAPYLNYAKNYVRLVDADSGVFAAEKYSDTILSFFRSIPAAKADFRYAPDKWSLKEMLQHIIDTERIFAYRALSLARGEKAALPGFDENEYADNSNASARDWEELLKEFEVVRASTDLLFRSFTPPQLKLMGTVNNYSANAEVFTIITYGHILHHINIIKERYLNQST